MAYSAPCPSCGAPVNFRSSVSLLAVCEFCRSTLVRHDKKIEDIGKMADLLPDQSILQIGTEGVFEGTHFAVIGRVQLKYEAGIWNEWHVLFDNMRSGWLSEAGGVSWMTFPRALSPAISLAQAQALSVGEAIALDGHAFTVTNIDSATCVAGQGELPFKVGAGYDLLSIDLRAGDTVATLDCSHDPAVFFLGKQVALGKLKLSNTRDLAEQTAKLPARSVKSFACPRCAAPLTVYSPKSLTIVCGSCGALAEADNPTKRLVDHANQAARCEPAIALGSEGMLKGQLWTVIGFMLKQTGHLYRWEEYLLINALGEFAWLVNSQGHWSYGQLISGTPKNRLGDRIWQNEVFQHFETYRATVVYVVGEFYWRVKTQDETNCQDFIAPPHMLSLEKTEQEQNWTLLGYLELDELAEAAGLTPPLPAPQGVGAIQPNPYSSIAWQVNWRFFYCAVLALAIQFLLVYFLPHGEVQQTPLTFNTEQSEEKLLARIHLAAPVKNVVIKGDADLNNTWAEFNFTITDEKTGVEMGEIKEVSYYSGWDSDGSWSEGSKNFRTHMGDLPPGDYIVSVDADLEPNRYVGARISLEYGQLSWGNFFLLEIFLLFFPCWIAWRKYAFEVERWADSDHPKLSSSSDE